MRCPNRMSPNVPGHFITSASSWRRAAPIVWGPPGSPAIYGSIDVDATQLLRFVQRMERELGRKVTVTHLVVAALARTLRTHAACNSYVRLGRVYQRRDVDLFVAVAQPPDENQRADDQRADLSGTRIGQADQKSIGELAELIASSASKLRERTDRELGGLKRWLAALPPWISRFGLRLVTFLQYELNLNLSRLGVPRDSFGGAFVSSMGMFGIRNGFAPLVPCMRFSAMLAIGLIEDRAVVVDGQIVVRPILPLSATLDHRVVDGYQAGRLCRTLTELLTSPEQLLLP